MNTVTFEVRPAVPSDAQAIAEVHVTGWRWAYRGQLPDTFLDGLSVEQRAAQWSKMLTAMEDARRIWVAVQSDRICGFITTAMPQEEGHPPSTAELQAIYLLENVVGTGVGRALLLEATNDLRKRGFKDVYLRVLDTNERARRFYELNGWSTDGATKVDQRENFVLNEVRYRLALDERL